MSTKSKNLGDGDGQEGASTEGRALKKEQTVADDLPLHLPVTPGELQVIEVFFAAQLEQCLEDSGSEQDTPSSADRSERVSD